MVQFSISKSLKPRYGSRLTQLILAMKLASWEKLWFKCCIFPHKSSVLVETLFLCVDGGIFVKQWELYFLNCYWKSFEHKGYIYILPLCQNALLSDLYYNYLGGMLVTSRKRSQVFSFPPYFSRTPLKLFLSVGAIQFKNYLTMYCESAIKGEVYDYTIFVMPFNSSLPSSDLKSSVVLLFQCLVISQSRSNYQNNRDCFRVGCQP